MFTIKFYSADGWRQIIREAESFTILRNTMEDGAEITLHQKSGDDCRIDIGPDTPRPEGWPPLFAKAIIENSMGRTTEIICTAGPARAPATQKGRPSTKSLPNGQPMYPAGMEAIPAE